MLQGFGNARRPSAGLKKDSKHWFDGQQKYSGEGTAGAQPSAQSRRAANTFQRLQAFLETQKGSQKDESPQ